MVVSGATEEDDSGNATSSLIIPTGWSKNTEDTVVVAGVGREGRVVEVDGSSGVVAVVVLAEEDEVEIPKKSWWVVLGWVGGEGGFGSVLIG